MRSRPARPPSLFGFFAAAFVISGLGFTPMIWASYQGADAVPAVVRPLEFLMLFGPALLAVTWAAREGGARAVKGLLVGLVRMRVHPAWYLVVVGPAILNALALLSTRVLGGVPVSVPSLSQVVAVFGPTMAVYLVLNTEELAWRGYAWPRMRDRLGALPASLALGILWAALHTPLFLLKGGHPGGWPPLLFLVMTLAFSVLFSLLYEQTGGSLLIAHLLHQALNAWGDALPIYPRVAGSLLPALFMVIAAVGIAWFAVRHAGWRWNSVLHRPSPAAGGIAA